MSPATKGHFRFILPNLYTFISFSCLTALSRTFSKMLRAMVRENVFVIKCSWSWWETIQVVPIKNVLAEGLFFCLLFRRCSLLNRGSSSLFLIFVDFLKNREWVLDFVKCLSSLLMFSSLAFTCGRLHWTTFKCWISLETWHKCHSVMAYNYFYTQLDSVC